MNSDPFSDRVAAVRARFVSSLGGKIDGMAASLHRLESVRPDAAEAAAEVYRCVHGIVGIGRTVGFPDTGDAAHAVEDVLRTPYQGGRGLNPDEISRLEGCLSALREAAARELQSSPAVSS